MKNNNFSINCRICNNSLKHTFVNLGVSPLANMYIKPQKINEREFFYPLHVYICEKCYLVQLPQLQSPAEIFGDYAYFSSYSESWLNHAKAYVKQMMERFKFNGESCIIEIASNDGYLLKFFKKEGVSVLGVEPAANVAKFAQEAGIPTLVKFFGVQTAKELAEENKYADLLIGNNVLAHVPDLNDFVEGMKIILKKNGIITMEFPHLMQLIEKNQFDTIYHEHFSYFSFITVERVFAKHNLTIFDVEELSTHGGSLRIYARHSDDTLTPINKRVSDLLKKETDSGFRTLEYYQAFSAKAETIKRNILDCLIKFKREGKFIAGYGAPAKGNTLLNYCGISTDFIDYTVDLNPHKQNHYLPGSRIPIFHPDKIKETKPDVLLILPWNLKEEIMEQMSHIREWGGQFLVLIPDVKVYL